MDNHYNQKYAAEEIITLSGPIKKKQMGQNKQITIKMFHYICYFHVKYYYTSTVKLWFFSKIKFHPMLRTSSKINNFLNDPYYV
jgi:hypothetical protein